MANAEDLRSVSEAVTSVSQELALLIDDVSKKLELIHQPAIVIDPTLNLYDCFMYIPIPKYMECIFTAV